ncbi:MAG: 16S rRNA (uracil(1498)-N(3))-methyltransferase [Proteobacteria bacterium]|nr:16S rRNA (uracil(1498)-N(3))-methyltransferase [Pseudomonadota bacterium]
MAAYDFTAPRLFMDAPMMAGARLTLTREQANYLLNVLRLGEKDLFHVFNGRDGEWRARLSGGTRKAPEILLEDLARPQTTSGDIWYLFAPLKAARLDYMVQKAVEMGASRLVPVMTHRTVASRVNRDRMRANVIEAAEQCGILSVADVAEEAPLSRALAGLPAGRTLIFCDEDAPLADPLAALGAIARGAPLAVLIGPEGGFDPEERARLLERPNHVRLSLGPRILRADTAAVAAMTLVQAALGDIGG